MGFISGTLLSTLSLGVSSNVQTIVALHDSVMYVVYGVGGFTVAVLCASFFYRGMGVLNCFEKMYWEIGWTVGPMVILSWVVGKSVQAIYSDVGLWGLYSGVGCITVKVTGAQWYWVYEVSGEGKVPCEMHSYMVGESGLLGGEARLLSVDKWPTVGAKSVLRFMVTSSDVMHSFSIPGLMVKEDCVPGRTNAASAPPLFRSCSLYGQCSEICGVNHAFMPIKLQVVGSF